MAKFELTPDQQNAVTARGGTVLVSAAAGSGKTRVLTERLAGWVTDSADPHDVGEFLVITYTRAAAAELRGRILSELQGRSAAAPENKRLRRQVSLCCRAPIGTIHSFCADTLREFGHEIGLTPDFRVGDEDKCAELREKALDKTLETAYAQIETDADFAALVDSVGAGRDDRRLENAVLDLHGKLQSHPFPEKWASEAAAGLQVSDLTDAGETVWGREILVRAGRTVAYWHDRLESCWQTLCKTEALKAAYGPSVAETLAGMRDFLRSAEQGWERARAALPVPFPRLKPLKDCEEEKAAFKAVRDPCKKAVQGVSALLDAPSEKLLGEIEVSAGAMRALLSLTIAFERAYAAEKKRLNLLDFSDLEHMAVKLLWDDAAGAPTKTARLLSKRYTEILVDEYQDVSAVQELLFQAVSRGGKNLFLVGDVKQSIYRFRLADPSIFLEKYKRFAPFGTAPAGEAQKILLQRNFRSDAVILDACNSVFENIMSEELGEVRYDADARLIASDTAPRRGVAELTLLALPEAEDAERPDKTLAEARMVAERIRALVAGGTKILDGGVERALRYGDIALLMRSPGTAGPAFRRALAEAGIPVLSEQGGGFFAAPEIQTVRALLSVIDNPHRDVPLTAALLSPVFGFTADELAAARACAPEGDLFSALSCAAQEKCAAGEKCAAFLSALDTLRRLSADIGVCQLLYLLYDRYALPEKCAAVSGGTLRLMQLFDLAAQFEENGYRGLYAFLRQLARMETRGEEPAAPSAGAADAVSIMSIHKSKGLEFPVVFLVNTGRKFNTADLRAPVLVHPKLGLGCKVTDLSRGIEYPTLARRAIAGRLTGELLSEEMRVLYVAMTRAKERLYISCAASEPDALLEKLKSGISSPLAPEFLRASPNMANWLLAAALLPGSALQLKIDRRVYDETAWRTEETPRKEADPETVAYLKNALLFQYAHTDSTALPAKLTATALPTEDPDGEPLLREHIHSFRVPELGAKRALTSAERGTATHIVMQFIDFSKTGTLPEIEDEIARIRALGQLTDQQAEAVDRGAVLRFFASDTGRRILRADSVWREQKFSVLCPSERFWPETRDEELLLQGVMDCVIEEKGTLTVMDYKTDYVTEESLPARAEHYRRQIEAYLFAAGELFEKPVAGGLLCFLRSGLTAFIPPEGGAAWPSGTGMPAKK